MRYLFRFLIVATCIGIVVFYSTNEPKPLEGPEIEVSEVEDVEELTFNNVSLERPSIGLSTYIGQSVEQVVKEYGQPHRIEKTPYQYEWWVYNQYELYMMLGVKDGVVTQVYTNSTAYNVAPYEMYMSEDDIFRMTIIDGEISVELGDNIYLYTMSDYDIQHRILVRFEDIYAQLYIDASSKRLSGIRFMDGETLVAHNPYEMQFLGEFNEQQPYAFTENMNYSNAQLLYELTNVFRLKEKLPTLTKSNNLSLMAQSHSEEMFNGQFVASDSPILGSLKDRAALFTVDYKTIEENIATGFYDAIEAVHSLLNSTKHRKQILGGSFTETGVGVVETYYTQVFVEPNIEEQ